MIFTGGVSVVSPEAGSIPQLKGRVQMLNWLIKIVLWTAAGYLGSRIMKDGTPNGFLGNMILGWIGGLIGNGIFNLIGVGHENRVLEILASVVGACLVIWIVRKFNLGRWFDKKQ